MNEILQTKTEMFARWRGPKPPLQRTYRADRDERTLLCCRSSGPLWLSTPKSAALPFWRREAKTGRFLFPTSRYNCGPRKTGCVRQVAGLSRGWKVFADKRLESGQKYSQFVSPAIR